MSDSSDVLWVKQVRISEGVSDPKKLKLLAKLMKELVGQGKRQKLVRDETAKALHGFGGHWQEVEERHPLYRINGKACDNCACGVTYLLDKEGGAYCAKCNTRVEGDFTPTNILSAEPIIHIHKVWAKGVKPHDLFGEVEAVQKHVQTYHYTFDPWEVEYFQTPRRSILDKMSGKELLDCDDMSILTCAMLGSIGYETAVLITNPRGPNYPFSHAMGAVKFPKPVDGFYGNAKLTWPDNKWIPLELTVAQNVGWLPEKADKFLFFKM